MVSLQRIDMLKEQNRKVNTAGQKRKRKVNNGDWELVEKMVTEQNESWIKIEIKSDGHIS